MLDRERRDLDVRDILAPQARRRGKPGGDRRVPGTGRDDPDGRLRLVERIRPRG